MPSYAIIFKIYFIDDFVIRQLDRIKAKMGSADLYVVVDETDRRIETIPHDRIVRLTESGMIQRGFAKGDAENSMFWYAADYSIYPLLEDYPGYDYYVTLKYDVVINVDLDELVG